MGRGRIFILDGPSGSGKSSIVAGLLRHSELSLRFCRRVTTRSPRQVEGEQDYDFISQEAFDRLEGEGQFASWRRFQFGMCYGLPRAPVEQLAQTSDVLAITDLGTIHQIKSAWPESLVIFLATPLQELETRLRLRGANSDEQIAERLENARRALEQVPYYDYVISNRQGHLQRTVERLAWIIKGRL